MNDFFILSSDAFGFSIPIALSVDVEPISFSSGFELDNDSFEIFLLKKSSIKLRLSFVADKFFGLDDKSSLSASKPKSIKTLLNILIRKT
ncbi:hypothetical protein PUN28_007533 [Cardiocondyla obscurior]|uniref:Uncharacterized protein n=1 Tax=Cardiocondyla obscurior TaxID=286306 RepID=A0AAW2G5S2_9HYME